MKSYILSFILSALFCSATAQQRIAPDSTNNKKFYAGVELTTISYIIGNREAAGSFSPYIQLNFGYRLSRRTNVQIGLARGGTNENQESIYYKTDDSTIYMNDSWNSRGVAIPLTVQFTPFNPGRRLNFYATASIIPIFGEVNIQHSETYEGETKTTYKAHDSGVYLLATAGIVLNYKISKRLEGYGKANLLYKHLGHYNDYAKRAKSVAIGLNYNF